MKTFLIEDHDEALNVWRRERVRGLDLIHIDAHIDLGLHKARSPIDIVNSAKSVKDITDGLEYSISYLKFEKDLRKQTDVGNYIYPAMAEGIVRDLYWVIPGRSDDFTGSKSPVIRILKSILRECGDRGARIAESDDIVSAEFMGRRIFVCNIDALPEFSRDVLLDIDTDYMVISSIDKADATQEIGERRPWIYPREVALILKRKIARPRVNTIAYSVNGGWTPIAYKYLGDELAGAISCTIPGAGGVRGTDERLRAGGSFGRFLRTRDGRFYDDAVRRDRSYRAPDNNYGPLYLAKGNIESAVREFGKILDADSANPAALSGLGTACMRRKRWRAAVDYFNKAIRSARRESLFRNVKTDALYGMAECEFRLRRFRSAARHLATFRKLAPMEPKSAYMLGRICEDRGLYQRAAGYYKDALMLGFEDPEPVEGLVRICGKLKRKNDTIIFARNAVKRYRRVYGKKTLARMKKRLDGIEVLIKRESF